MCAFSIVSFVTTYTVHLAENDREIHENEHVKLDDVRLC